MDINATLCNKIVDNMVKYVENDKETQKEKLNYYIRVIMDGVGNFAIMLLVFLLSGFGIEYIACYIALSVTRTFLGGFHLKTGDQCLMMTFGVFYVCIVLGHICDVAIPAKLLVLVCWILVVWLYGPFKSPQRPRYSDAKKQRFRILATTGGCIVVICSIIFGKYVFSGCIMWVMIYQLTESILFIAHERINNLNAHKTFKGKEG